MDRKFSGIQSFHPPVIPQRDFFEPEEIKMAGKPGMKGGGGPRPGAGRPPSQPQTAVLRPTTDPQRFLRAVMNANDIDLRLRLAAANALLRYEEPKASHVGKKARAQEEARTAHIGTGWEGLL